MPDLLSLVRTGPRAAIDCLRRVHARWHVPGFPKENDPGHPSASHLAGLLVPLVLGVVGAATAAYLPVTPDRPSILTGTAVCGLDVKIQDSTRAAVCGQKPRTKI